MKADVDILYYVLGEVAEKAKEDNEFIKVLLKLEQFVEIHKTRTRDMVTYRDTIEKAREEYRSLSLKYRGLEELYQQTRSTLTEVINRKIEEDVDF